MSRHRWLLLVPLVLVVVLSWSVPTGAAPAQQDNDPTPILRGTPIVVTPVCPGPRCPTVGPAPTAGPSPTAGAPTPPPTATTAPITAPCYLAAVAALSKQGALYSQGGALAGDPKDPATGQYYPRTGPNSFDCSGLVWWAYAQAGITVGANTYGQINDGVAISCTLAHLHGTTTTCWAPGDLVFLEYPGGQHVAIYISNGLFMDCYNHDTGCILHDVTKDSFYRKHFSHARRIVSGCEGLAIDPGEPIPNPPRGMPQGDASVCVPVGPHWTDKTGVSYSPGCGPPVHPPGPILKRGTKLRQFVGYVGWLGLTGRMFPPGPAGAHLHLGLKTGSSTNACRWPLQAAGVPEDQVPPGGTSCMTEWADPVQFLPQANGDTLAVVNGTPVPVAYAGGGTTPQPRPTAAEGEVRPLAEGTPVPAISPVAGDLTLSDALMQLPPPGHPATLLLEPTDVAKADGTWWSPGNDDRAEQRPLAMGGPQITNWLWDLWCRFFWWLPGSGCTAGS